MIITPASLALLNKGFRTNYDAGYQGAAPVTGNLYTKVPSGSSEEVLAWLGALPGMKELVGEVKIENVVNHGYTIRNKEWESTVAVKELAIKTDQYGQYAPLMSGMGVAARQHPDQLIAALLEAGFSTDSYTGTEFFGTNHEPVKGKTKFSNLGTKKLSAANFETARANIKARKNSAGRAMGIGTKLVLVVSPTYEATARQIVLADTAANGATNVNKGTADLLVLSTLTAEHNWFLLDVGATIRPLLLTEVQAPTFTALNAANDSFVMLKHEYLYQSYGIYNAGYGLPELAYGSTGADAA
jgi:phage major head subunit gpT-like protein